ncbi:hypothetical protein RRG08_017029 [Elysia crispata]|uniref:Uncharacterized protein n=1 Tax=Elysia crispata TaxID=231223 RepID=A0AAE1CPU8_9GAST|nr:hypothetical protein RRG08_017029 [Elysia crispata]
MDLLFISFLSVALCGGQTQKFELQRSIEDDSLWIVRAIPEIAHCCNRNGVCYLCVEYDLMIRSHWRIEHGFDRLVSVKDWRYALIKAG